MQALAKKARFHAPARFISGIALLVLCFYFFSHVQAQTLPAGGLTVMQAGQPEAVLSPAQLAALPQHTTVTATPWTDGVKTFRGPLVSDVLKAAGVSVAPGMVAQAQALNGYVVEIPAEDFARWPVILAFSMDGQTLTRRDKGPLWVVYPRDSDPQLKDAKYDHRWAWQLKQISVQSAPTARQ